MKVNSDFSGDWMKEFDGLIPPMLEDGVDVLIYGADSVRWLYCWSSPACVFFLARKVASPLPFRWYTVLLFFSFDLGFFRIQRDNPGPPSDRFPTLALCFQRVTAIGSATTWATRPGR